MARTKVWQSRAWLYRKRIVERLTVEEIARQARCAESTIYNMLKQFGLK